MKKDVICDCLGQGVLVPSSFNSMDILLILGNCIYCYVCVERYTHIPCTFMQIGFHHQFEVCAVDALKMVTG
jgi:hypothetical protein